MRLKDKVAVVTGGGRGIGRAIALAFAQEGANVVVTARTASEIDSVAAEIHRLGRKGVALPVDLSQREAIHACVESIVSHFSSVDILVNNAGVGGAQNPNPVARYDDDFWDMSLFVNLTAPYLLMKAFLPNMIEQRWGRIITIASTAAKRGSLNRSAYSVSKHGLVGLTRSAALEVATSGVTVNAICPGPIRTAMLTRLLQYRADLQGISLEAVEQSVNPMKRLLEPEEVAAMAVYLASEAAGGVTGQALNIDGGNVMH
jgi:NAD(P)-dependent dehydrogenase (short-subunit alcohol dehydrogenase family)